MGKMGRPKEKEGKRKPVTVRLPEDKAIQMQHYALAKKVSLSAVLEEVALKWWEDNPEREKYEKIVELSESGRSV